MSVLHRLSPQSADTYRWVFRNAPRLPGDRMRAPSRAHGLLLAAVALDIVLWISVFGIGP